MRVLLIEDDAMIGRNLVRGLTNEGMAVDWVRSGIDGQARPPRTLSRHHRGSSAVETGSTAYVAVAPVPAP